MNFSSKLQHGLSRFAGMLANSKLPVLSHFLIWLATKALHIDLSESELQNFTSLNDLFTRKLKSSARPLAPKPAVMSPVDGTLSAMGIAVENQLFTIKHHTYSLDTLFGHQSEFSSTFMNGHYALYYLAPHNYHRVHMPCDGTLTHMISLPGQLHSVNEKLAPADVFSRNERVIALFNVPGGQMAVIFVGALLVGSIHTKWAGSVSPCPINPMVNTQSYPSDQYCYARGDEIGHFQFGSSILVLFSQGTVQWNPQEGIDKSAKMGDSHGEFIGKPS